MFNNKHNVDNILSIRDNRKEPADYLGVYFLIKNDTIVYIGRSKCIMKRIAHVRGDTDIKIRLGHNIKFDSYASIKCFPDEVGLYEKLYISRYKPKYNTKDYHFQLQLI